MKTLPFLPQHFLEISKHLNMGLPIILPTETSYGFSGNITSKTAIHAVELIKNRNNKKDKAFLILVDSFTTLKNFSDISELSKENINYIKKNSNFFEFNSKNKPTTFILKKNIKNHPFLQNYFSNFKHIGIRVPQYAPLIGFLKNHNTPLFSTSANFSKQLPIYKKEDIIKNFSNIPNLLFVDAGDLQKNPPSSIIQFNKDGELIRLR